MTVCEKKSSTYRTKNESKHKELVQNQFLFYHYLQRELEAILPQLNEKWGVQNDKQDKLSNFIYRCDSFDDVKWEYERVKEKVSFSYVLKRWFNYKTSKMTEDLFASYNVCEPEKDKKHKEIDFYLYDVPFDLKVTIMPKAFFHKERHYFNKREKRDELLRWFYLNQSKEQRQHFANRLFVVCWGENYETSKDLKCNFDLILAKINAFLEFTHEKRKQNPQQFFNSIQLDYDKKKYQVLSDALIIQK